jgi:hypothetical protein
MEKVGARHAARRENKDAGGGRSELTRGARPHPKIRRKDEMTRVVVEVARVDWIQHLPFDTRPHDCRCRGVGAEGHPPPPGQGYASTDVREKEAWPAEKRRRGGVRARPCSAWHAATTPPPEVGRGRATPATTPRRRRRTGKGAPRHVATRGWARACCATPLTVEKRGRGREGLDYTKF